MNGKTFAVIYLLIIVAGYLSVVTLLEYHTTIISRYSGSTEVFQEGNEYVANITKFTFVKDIYLYKTDYLDVYIETITIARGPNASQVIQSAIDGAGTVFFNAGMYNMTNSVWVGNSTFLIGDYGWTAIFTKGKFYVKPNASQVIFEGLNATMEP